MALILCTKRCFLVCEDIISITVQDTHYDDEERPRRSKRPTLLERIKYARQGFFPPVPEAERTYCINLQYIMPQINNYGNSGSAECLNIEVQGKEETLRLFKELVTEIREQKPDTLYLDKLIENVLGEEPEMLDNSADKKENWES